MATERRKKPIRTSVILTRKAEAILAKYRHPFGIKATLSVALELFDELDLEQQFALTRAALREETGQQPEDAKVLWDSVRAMISSVPETAYQVLSDEQAEEVRKLREVLGESPEEAAHRIVRDAATAAEDERRKGGRRGRRAGA